jgi:hypothetical protein
MKDLTSARWIKIKGLLFLLIGIVTAVLIFLDDPDWKTALLLVLAIGSFLPVLLFRVLCDRKVR